MLNAFTLIVDIDAHSQPRLTPGHVDSSSFCFSFLSFCPFLLFFFIHPHSAHHIGIASPTFIPLFHPISTSMGPRQMKPPTITSSPSPHTHPGPPSNCTMRRRHNLQAKRTRQVTHAASFKSSCSLCSAASISQTKLPNQGILPNPPSSLHQLHSPASYIALSHRADTS